MDEVTLSPIYYYVDKNQVRSNIRGFYRNPLDNHPLSELSREAETPAAAP